MIRIGTRQPFVALGVDEFQSLSHLMETDTMAAVVSSVLGKVAVADGAHDSMVISTDVDMDKARKGGADAMLEGVLHQ